MRVVTANVNDSKNSYVEISDKSGIIAMVGADATKLYAAMSLLRFLKLYLKTGMLPTRGATGPKMLQSATQYTGVEYKGKWQV